MVFEKFAILLVILISFIYLIFKFWTHRKLGNALSKIPGLSVYPIIGDTFHFMRRTSSDATDSHIHVALLESMNGYAKLFRKEGLYRCVIGGYWYVVLFSGNNVEPMLKSNILEKGIDYNLLHCWLGTGLLTSSGDKWKSRRKLLTPTFHYSILDDFVPIFYQQSKTLVQCLEKLKDDFVDIVPHMSKCTLDIICETAMGVKLGCQKDTFNEYLQAVNKVCDTLINMAMNPYLFNDFINSFTPIGRQRNKALKVVHGFVRKVIEKRKAEVNNTKESTKDEIYNKKRRRAFLDLLLELQRENNPLTDEDIQEEVNTFMFGGHDTTSTGISWALYHLGRYSDIQEKVYGEVMEIFGSEEERPITCEDLKRMKYLECVLKESQRLTPSVPMISRSITKNLSIGDYNIPPGSFVTVFIYALHRDPEVFPNPEEFDPDRFLSENAAGRHPFAYIPFSAGSRNCIGQRFAMMEMKTIVSYILRNFIIKSVHPFDKIVQSYSVVLRSKHGLRLNLTRRK